MSEAYKKSGVDISKGDLASKKAYAQAIKTFSSRKGMIGSAVEMQGGFAGALDMGDFYLVKASDGTGTKMKIAEKLGKFDTIGYDLLAMVCDDIICTGSETISITNSLDVRKVEPEVIEKLLEGLSKACQEQKIIIAGGEIAEVGDTVNSIVWNSSAVGISEKDKFIFDPQIKEGDKIISLNEPGFRSNGFSLIRKVLEENFGEDWEFEDNWGERVLIPSTIYSSAVLSVIGRFGEKSKAKVKALAHITGGGIPGNLNRILKGKFGAKLDNLHEVPSDMLEIQKLGKISDEDIYRTFCMGNGMMLISDPQESEKILKILEQEKVKAKIAGEINMSSKIEIIRGNDLNLIF